MMITSEITKLASAAAVSRLPKSIPYPEKTPADQSVKAKLPTVLNRSKLCSVFGASALNLISFRAVKTQSTAITIAKPP